jgi:hypothetical protein
MKNTLQENMRRFGTKNLMEQTQPAGFQLPLAQQSLYRWVTEWAVPRGFKIVTENPSLHMWKLSTMRGDAWIELNIFKGAVTSMEIGVTRSGVSKSAEKLYRASLKSAEATPERIRAIQQQLEPYVKR